MIVYTDRLVPRGFAAITVWPFVFMRPHAEAHNPGIFEHEQVHYAQQAWITPIWWLAYLLSPRFRVAAEVQAYRASIRNGLDPEVAARELLRYDHTLDIFTALDRLRGLHYDR